MGQLSIGIQEALPTTCTTSSGVVNTYMRTNKWHNYGNLWLGITTIMSCTSTLHRDHL